MRATLASLPYKCPKRLVKYLLKDTVELVNTFPNSKTTPIFPREKCEGRKLDVEANLRAAWGDIVLVLDKVDNTLEARKVWGIVVGHDFSSEGPVHIWIPGRDSYVHESRFDIVEAPQQLIDQLAELSKEDEDNLSIPLLLTEQETEAGVIRRHLPISQYLANWPPPADKDDQPAAIRDVLGPLPTR